MNKNILFSIVILILTSCNTPTKRDLLVIDKISTIDENTKVDLQVEIKSSKELGNVLGKDSLNFYLKEFTKEWGNPNITLTEYLEKRNGNLETTQEFVDEYNSKIDSVKNAENQYLLPALLQGLLTAEKYIIQYEFELNIINSLKEKENEILAKKVEYNYSIVNPMLNNAKQDITKTFLFSANESKIKGSI